MASAAVQLGLVLPPSEGKAAGGDGSTWSAGLGQFAELEARRAAPGPQARTNEGRQREVAPPLSAWAANRFVVDLLPNDHRAACSAAHLRGFSVAFVDRTGTVAGHDAKAAKGRLVHHLLTTRGHPLDALRSWDDPRFDLLLTPIGG